MLKNEITNNKIKIKKINEIEYYILEIFSSTLLVLGT